MLTEAHRIESDRAEKSISRTLEDRIAELEAAVGGQEDDFEPDGSEDQAQHRPSRIVYTRPPASEEEASLRKSARRLSQIALIETGPANDDGEHSDADAPAFRRVSEPVEEAPMAEDVPHVDPPSAEVAAFTDPDDVVQKIEARIVSGRPISEPLQLVEPKLDGAKPKDAAKAEPATDEVDDFDTALSEAVAASLVATENRGDGENSDHAVKDVLSFDEFAFVDLNRVTTDPQITAAELLAQDGDTLESTAEAAIPAPPKAQAGETPQIDAPQSDTAQAESTPAEVKVEKPDTPSEPPAKVAEDMPPQPETPAEPVAEAAEALAALPDEEAMRLLVTRLIREELAGDLGERITRNMRKLVRREIKRAFNSNDLS